MCVRVGGQECNCCRSNDQEVNPFNIPFTQKVDELFTNSCSGVVFADSLRVRINGLQV